MARKYSKKDIKKIRAHNAILLAVCVILCVVMCCSLIYSENIERLINKEYYAQLELLEESKSSGELVFNESDLCVSYVSVESADAIVIELPDGKVMLIDSAVAGSKQVLLDYLSQNIYNDRSGKVLDYFVITHPDADHYGATVEIMEEYDVKNIYRPKALAKDEGVMFANDGKTTDEDSYSVKNTVRYNQAINAIYAEVEKGATMRFNSAGIVINGNTTTANPYKFTFLAPTGTNYSNSNSYSAVILLEYKQKKLLFTGDATGDTDAEMIDYARDNSIDLSCDVLKVAHHGSVTNGSNSQEVLDAFNPTYAIISCKEGTYSNLPASQLFERLRASGVADENVLRTDVCGTILVGFSTEDKLMVLVGDELIEVSGNLGEIVYIHWYIVVVVVIALIITFAWTNYKRVSRSEKKMASDW